jgi:hypothetical protein
MSILTHTSRIIHTALFSLSLLPALLHAEQEDRWYQVEVIVFSQNNPEYHTSERWPLDYALPNMEQSRELVNPASLKTSQPAPLLPQPFSLVSAERLQLGETARRIQNARDVELVLHLGWLQPGLAEEQAVAVHIYDGMPQTAAAANSTEPVSPATEGDMGTPPRLDGTLRLILSRYLHIQSDLLWREPLPNQLGFAAEQSLINGGTATPQPAAMDNDATHVIDSGTGNLSDNGEMTTESTAGSSALNYQVYRMQQSRRMRSNEVHYLDHPLFGIIVQVTPYITAQVSPKP